MTHRLRRKPGAPAGIYVHLPFCRHQCPYCDYPVVEGDPEGRGYLEALSEEFEARREAFDGRRIESIYFGGGTPSLAPPAWIGRVVEWVRGAFGRANREVTLESNPEDVRGERLEDWRDAGVDRLVVGVQSFQSATLESLGRRHGPQDAERALEAAIEAPCFDVGLDLLFGVPRQTISEWRADLARLESLEGFDAVFFQEYVAPQASGGSARTEGRSREGPSESLRATMFREAKEAARRLGMARTGVGAFTCDGEEGHRPGRHMELYWTGGEYLGLGMGASSFRILDSGEGSAVATRRRNSEDLGAYLADPVGAAERRDLEAAASFAERLSSGFRSARGISWPVVRQQFEGAVSEETLTRGRDVLEWCMDRKFATQSGGRLRPTDRGLDVADGLDRELRRRIVDGGSRGAS